MLVEVRPLPEKKWHGKTGKESFAQPKTVEVLYNHDTGKYATGLTPEEAAEYSKKLGVDLSDTFNPNEPHPYWSTKAATIRLQNNTMFFDTSKPAEFVKVKNLKASKLVANSMKEWNNGKWKEATHVIFDEEEEINAKASRIAMQEEAILIKSKMSDQDKADMIQIIGTKSVKGRSTDFINVELNALIEEKPAEFLKYAKMGREEVHLRSMVLECVHAGILQKDAGSIFYMGDLIGIDIDEAVKWFKDPVNSRLKISILDKLVK